MTGSSSAGGPTAREVALPRGEAATLVVGGALLGLVVGGLLPLVAGGLAELPFMPARDLLVWAAEFGMGRTWFPLVTALVLGLAGALLGVLAADRASRIRVTARDVVVVADGEARRFARSQVGEAVCEGNVLVLRDAADVDLLRQKLDVAPERVRAALDEFGWPSGASSREVDDAPS